MTLGDKIIALRKRECWSQEDLADRLDVSRQSVSKWESGQAAPAIDKLLEMSRLFAVSTDYLLKEELGTWELPAPDSAGPAAREVTLAEAETFLAMKQSGARPIALAAALCILSPVALILLSGLSEIGRMREELAAAIGLTAMFAFIVPAVGLFVFWGTKLGKYEYLEKQLIAPDPGVETLARERMTAMASARTRRLVIGVCLCVAAAVPLFAAMGAQQLATLLSIGGMGLLLVLVAGGVYLIVASSIPWGACQMLLQEEDYAPERKNPWRRVVRTIYWCAVTAGYLVWSFFSKRWGDTWVVWPVAAVLYGAVDAALHGMYRRKK